MHCVHLRATKGRVGNDLLAICGSRLEDLSEEDFQDLHLAHPELTLYKLRAAWEKCMNQWFTLQGLEQANWHTKANSEADALACELGVE